MSSPKTTDPYEAMRTRRHWKREQAARVLSEWASSGESLTTFARRHRLSLHRLQWWRVQLGRVHEVPAAPVRLIPAVPRQAPLIAVERHAQATVCLEVGETRIEVHEPNQTDPRWLAALVSELRGGRS